MFALRLDARIGAFSVSRGLDREIIFVLLLFVEVIDRFINVSRRRVARVFARVFVTDENDNAFVFVSFLYVRLFED